MVIQNYFNKADYKKLLWYAILNPDKAKYYTIA
jgi:hypothetical protein